MFGSIKQMMVMGAADNLIGFVAEKILRQIPNATKEQQIMATLHASRIVIFALMSERAYQTASFDEDTSMLSIEFENDVYNVEIGDNFKDISFDNFVVSENEDESYIGKKEEFHDESIEDILNNLILQQRAAQNTKEILDQIKKK